MWTHQGAIRLSTSKHGHVWSCYVMLGYVRLFPPPHKKKQGCQMPQTQLLSFSVNWQAPNFPRNRLRPWVARNRPSHLEEKQNRMLRWKLFPVDQWISWGRKIWSRKNGLNHRCLLKNCSSFNQESWGTSWPKTSGKTWGSLLMYQTTLASEVFWPKWECNMNN